MDIYKILDLAINKGATDIHIADGLVPVFRIKKILVKQTELLHCNKENITGMVKELLKGNEEKYKILEEEKRLDLGFKYNGF